MILSCKDTCAPVSPPFKVQGVTAPVMHLRSAVPDPMITVSPTAQCFCVDFFRQISLAQPLRVVARVFLKGNSFLNFGRCVWATEVTTRVEHGFG